MIAMPPNIQTVAIYEENTSRRLGNLNTKASDEDLSDIEAWCLFSPVSFNPLVKHELKLEKLGRLPFDWDGFEAIPPYDESISNCYKFISRMPREVIDMMEDDQYISASNYGTIVLDLTNKKGEKVSIEFGKTKIGFYTNFADNNNWTLDSQLFNYNAISKDLKNAITKLVQNNLL
jgi:hypothetical protein